MGSPSLLERAKAGDAVAIAGLLNQALQAQGIQVQAERKTYCLILWLQGQILPPQEATVSYIRRGVERLRIPSIGVVQIHAAQEDNPDGGWTEEISLLAAFASSEEPPPPVEESVVEVSPPPTPEPAYVPPPSTELDRAYERLELDPGASLPSVEAAYFQLKSQYLRQGRREEIDALKAAYGLLKEYLRHRIKAIAAHEAALPRAIAGFPDLFQSRGLNAQVKVLQSQLHIRLTNVPSAKAKRAIAVVYTLLEQQDLTALGLTDLSEIVICGLGKTQKIVWKRTVPMPQQGFSDDDTDLMSFKNRYVSAFGFPALMVLGMLMNAVPIVDFFLRGIKIWFHEFGHATVAWLGGRRAIPLPIGWTNIGAERSLFVYVGLLVLFGLMFWVGRREQRRWPMVLAVVLAIVQFWMTWLLPVAHFETWLSFGGIGGEFYLCTLLMVSFYFPLPQYWRWDFYRYPVVLGAAYTFWGQIWLWRQIDQGRQAIPWGSIWGGPNHGDMNDLSQAGWSNQQIIDTYNTLGNICLLVLLSVYIYFALKQNRHYLFALTQRWLAR